MADVELHDEIVEWMSSLDDADWNRTVVAIDRLAGLGSTARTPFSRALGDGLFELRFSLGPTARRITYRFTTGNRIILLTTSASNATTSEPRSLGLTRSPSNALGSTRRSTDMANYSRWDGIKKQRPGPTDEERAAIEQDFALGELIYELRTSAGLSQRELAERMSTTQSVISRLEEGGGGRPRLDTLARVATALDRHLVVSFPDEVPKRLKDAIQVA